MQDAQLLDWVDDIDTALVRYFAKKDLSANPLDRAMEYTLLAGGKRLRALLPMVVCDELGGDATQAMPFSLAMEFLHTYSLIHDDLPCMDDDDMRRGKPANHVVFGEANAILAGDALQAEAFLVLAQTAHEKLKAERRVAILSEFATAVGRQGMVAGQVMDLSDAGKTVDLERLSLLHGRKTGALLTFCVRLGGHLADADEATMTALTTYGEAIGLLFQVVDDLLDESEHLGKTAGKDADQNKATFPKLMGADAAREFADKLARQAEDALASLTLKTDRLSEITRFIHQRDY